MVPRMTGLWDERQMLPARLFPDEEFSVATHDAGMFTVKEINRLKILR